jgi:hypothetical protein
VVTPAIFYKFGRPIAEKTIAERAEKAEREEETLDTWGNHVPQPGD